ncbi:MAG: hypothetical protein MPJ50_13560 [Pirellulales bacterium]|nr:hypothetical protein [Pirellulales bacterium]
MSQLRETKNPFQAKRHEHSKLVAFRDPTEVLVVGNTLDTEIQPALNVLHRQALVAMVKSPLDVSERLRTWSPELFIVHQAYPAQWTPSQLNSLRAASPASRQILIEGSCCEGEGRSSDLHTGLWRIYWHQASALLEIGLKQRAAGRAAWWSAEPERSRLAAAQTRGICDIFATIPTPTDARVAVICSADADFSDLLADAIHDFGWRPLPINVRGMERPTQTLQAMHGADMLLWDCDSGEDLPAPRQPVGCAPALLAFVGAVRPEDVTFIDRSTGWRTARLLSKPFDLASLHMALTDMSAKRGMLECV